MLKVLKLESQAGKDSRAKGVAAPSNLSMNQTLEGQQGGSLFYVELELPKVDHE